MKTLVLFLFLLVSSGNCLGATTPKLQSSSSSDESYFDTETFLWSRLPLGSYDRMTKFMLNQIGFISVVVEDQNGNYEFNNPYLPILEGESLEEFAVRVANIQLTHAINVSNFPKNQKLTISFVFLCGATNGINKLVSHFVEAYTGEYKIVPIASGNGYAVPSNFASLLKIKPNVGTGVLEISWTQIKKASLVVFNKASSLVYSGSSTNRITDTNFHVMENYTLTIANRFLTNGNTGVLVVSTGSGYSAMYQLIDGAFVYDQRSVPPLMTISRAKNGSFKIGVMGGAPFQSISLLTRTNLNAAPIEEQVELDAVGSFTWTPSTSYPSGFFSTKYPGAEQSATR